MMPSGDELKFEDVQSKIIGHTLGAQGVVNMRGSPADRLYCADFVAVMPDAEAINVGARCLFSHGYSDFFTIRADNEFDKIMLGYGDYLLTTYCDERGPVRAIWTDLAALRKINRDTANIHMGLTKANSPLCYLQRGRHVPFFVIHHTVGGASRILFDNGKLDAFLNNGRT